MPSRLALETDAVARLLLVDGVPGRSEMLADEFCRNFAVSLAAHLAADGREAASMLRRGPHEIVLMDLGSLCDLAVSPEEAVGRLVKLADGALAVVLSEAATVSAAVAVMGAGAHDFVARPIGADALASRVGELARRHGKTRLIAEPPSGSGGVIGDLAASRERRDTQAAARRPAVLPMWQQEQRIIEEAIASYAGNIALAAAALELSPSTIYRKRQAWAEMDDKRGAA